MAAGPSRAECQGHGAAGGLPPSTAAPDTVALCQGSPAGAEALGAVPPQILVTDFSAASPAGWHCPDPQPEPGEEDSEQDAREASEDGGSSVGASPVALDPVEKEWLQGAAGGDLPVLSHLLQQEPALATKKDFTSGFTALHWAAKHGKEDMAAMLVDAGADINMRAHGVSMLGWTDGRAAGLAPDGGATPPCTLPRSTGTARSWTCSSSASGPSRTCGTTAGTWPGTTWALRGRWTGTPTPPSCPRAGVSAAGTGAWPACCCPRPAGRRGAAGARPRTLRSQRKSEPRRSSSHRPRPTGPSASSPASPDPAPRRGGGLGGQARSWGRTLAGSAVKLRVHRVPAPGVPVCAVPVGPRPLVGPGGTAPRSAPARGGSAQGRGVPGSCCGCWAHPGCRWPRGAAVPCQPLPDGSRCGGRGGCQALPQIRAAALTGAARALIPLISCPSPQPPDRYKTPRSSSPALLPQHGSSSGRGEPRPRAGGLQGAVGSPAGAPTSPAALPLPHAGWLQPAAAPPEPPGALGPTSLCRAPGAAAQDRALPPLLPAAPARGAGAREGDHGAGEHRGAEGLAGPAPQEPLPQQGREGDAGHGQPDEPHAGLHLVRQRPAAPQEGEQGGLGSARHLRQRGQRGRGGSERNSPRLQPRPRAGWLWQQPRRGAGPGAGRAAAETQDLERGGNGGVWPRRERGNCGTAGAGVGGGLGPSCPWGQAAPGRAVPVNGHAARTLPRLPQPLCPTQPPCAARSRPLLHPSPWGRKSHGTSRHFSAFLPGPRCPGTTERLGSGGGCGERVRCAT
nr:collagen alpha-1(I) chain-like isoform X2 [Anser cygnoides]